MSDPGQGKREWRFYLEDMIKFALKVQSYTQVAWIRLTSLPMA